MRQNIAIVSGIAEFVLSFLLGVGVAYFSFRLLTYLTLRLDDVRELKKNNTAAGIILAAALISIALVARESIYPVIATLQTKLFSGMDVTAALALLALSLAYVAFAMFAAALAVVVGTKLFMHLNRDIDEMGEIQANNVAVALTLGAVIVVMGLFLSNGAQGLLSAIIPEPSLARIQVLGGGR